MAKDKSVLLSRSLVQVFIGFSNSRALEEASRRLALHPDASCTHVRYCMQTETCWLVDEKETQVFDTVRTGDYKAPERRKRRRRRTRKRGPRQEVPVEAEAPQQRRRRRRRRIDE